MLDRDRRLENKEKITDHVVGFYRNHFSKEEWDRPTFDNLGLPLLDSARADRLENAFEEEEVKEAILNCVCGWGRGGGIF